MTGDGIARTWVLPVFSLFLAAFAVGTTEFVIGGLLPVLARDLGVDIPTAGLLITGYAIGVAVGGPLLALATGGLPRRSLLLALMVVFILGNGLCALATSYWLLLGVRLVVAATHGLFFGAATVLATRLVPRERQSSAISFVIAGIPVANVLGVPIGTAIGNAYGWRATFWAIALVATGATFTIGIFTPRSTTEEKRDSSRLISEVRAIRRQTVLLSYLMIALYATGVYAIYAYIVPLLLSVTAISPGTVPWLLFIGAAGGVVGNLIGGRLGDWKPMAAVIAVFTLVLAIYLAMLLAVYDPMAMAVTLFLWWMIGISFVAPVQARILRGAADAPHLASTLISTAFNIGIAVGPWLGGLALNAEWGYARLPLISIFFVAAALAVAILSAVLERRAGASVVAPAF
jgi:DHA1 family inner membrane transport protein